ncbi:MAG: hypothetical protein M1814_006148 [Vezdaea aestivalis]|nr:MAG: hypothetical protein M1814_006148 [Vezdaea aestivalis]
MPKKSVCGSSSPESTEHESNFNSWTRAQDDGGEEEATSQDEEASNTHSSAPVQKRRRVTRACDECRRKKIKCDGKQPCTHCQVYSYSCTYDQPSNRRRNPAPQYIEALELRLQKTEALLKTFLPDVDISKVIGAPLPHSGISSKAKESKSTQASQLNQRNVPELECDSQLESMIENTGSLDLDDQGFWDFHGHSSGLTFLSRLEEKFGNILPPPDIRTAARLKSRPGLRGLDEFFSSPSGSPKSEGLPNVADLPAQKVAKTLASNALDYACCLMRFVHQPTFYAMFERVYSLPHSDWKNEDNRFLALLYGVLALGCLFAPNEKGELDQGGWENATNRGYSKFRPSGLQEANQVSRFKYFFACRQALDFTDCRDIQSLQALMFMIMFLQSSAKLATCYGYIGIALRSALRMGFHRSIKADFNPVELETRKRMFWVIRKMDIYVSAILGMPQSVALDEIDQEYPLEIDDQYITMYGITTAPKGHFSTIAAANAHTSLIDILSNVIKYIYPIKPTVGKNKSSSRSYSVSHAKILELEQDLVVWREGLPPELKPGAVVPLEIERVQQLLRMAFAHVQMLLYRPFLHYASQNVRSKTGDKRSYACAAACISVARNIVHITSNMKQRGFLAGSYWLSMYTTFFAILSLVFYVLENPNDETSAACWQDAIEGKETLASLARRSHAADRCQISLTTLFKQLPERLGKGRPRQPLAKKRQAPSIRSERGSAKSKENLVATTRSNSYPLVSENAAVKQEQMQVDASPRLKEILAVDSIQRRSFSDRSPISFGNPLTPENRGTSGPHPTQLGQFGQVSYNPNADGLPDIGPIMFPSDDPFAYPSMPAAVLSGSQIDPGCPSAVGQSPNGMLFAQDSKPIGDLNYDVETQLYGPMAPYMMSGQQPGLNSQFSPNGLNLAAFGMDPGSLYSQQGRTGFTPGVNMEDLFNGDEWTAYAPNQNFPQQTRQGSEHDQALS